MGALLPLVGLALCTWGVAVPGSLCLKLTLLFLFFVKLFMDRLGWLSLSSRFQQALVCRCLSFQVIPVGLFWASWDGLIFLRG